MRHDAAMRAEQRMRVAEQARRLRPGLLAIVAEVADRIARAQSRLRPADVQRKAVGDFVTRIDVQSERRLRRELLALFPEAGFLGEESDPHELTRDWLWVVDPIDGTSNFARGLPQFAVSAALLHRGQPVLAAVHCAPERAMFSAILGDGTRRERRRVTAPKGRFDDGAIVGCQWFRGQAQMEFLAALQSTGARIRTLGSTVVQLCDCVMGRLDANVQQQGRVWDFAAAGLIAVEAGMKFTDWSGRAVFPIRDLQVGHTATIAARPAVHRRVLALLQPFAAPDGT